MIKITKQEFSLIEDFANESRFYSCPSVALKSFNAVLEAYGYHMDYTIAADTLHDSILVDIVNGNDFVGFAHIAWCRYSNARYCVTGRIIV